MNKLLNILNMKKTILILALLPLFGVSCTKEKLNEKRLGGIWEGKKVQYLIYNNNNELLKDSTVDNSGALYLYDDDELDNQFRYSLEIVPGAFSFYDTWEGNEGDANSLMGTNIRKLTRRKLELSENVTDTSLNVLKTVIYFFERQ